jgi:hypothetical protein
MNEFDNQKVNATLHRSVRSWGFGLAAMLAAWMAPGASAAPVLYRGTVNDTFYSVGVMPDGTAVIAGKHSGSEGFFSVTNGALAFTPLQTARNPVIVDDLGRVIPGVLVSRDGQYFVSIPNSGAPLFWHREPALVSSPLPNNPVWETVSGIAMVHGEPVVIGTALAGFINLPMLWSESGGFRDAAAAWGAGTPLYGMSEDGHIVGGGSLNGELVIRYGTETNSTILHGEGNDNFDVKGFSPNGRFILADFGRSVFSQTVVWRDGAVRLLAQPDDLPARASGAISDSGFVGGQGRSLSQNQPNDGRAFIYDPFEKHSFWFTDWWASNTGSPLNAAPNWVTDLCESGGQLYMLLETANQGPLLAVAPIQNTAAAPSISIVAVDPGTIRVTWPALAGSVLEMSNALPGNWTSAPTIPVESFGNFTAELPPSGTATFFRVRVQ